MLFCRCQLGTTCAASKLARSLTRSSGSAGGNRSLRVIQRHGSSPPVRERAERPGSSRCGTKTYSNIALTSCGIINKFVVDKKRKVVSIFALIYD